MVEVIQKDHSTVEKSEQHCHSAALNCQIQAVMKRVQDVGAKAGRGVAPTDQLWVYV